MVEKFTGVASVDGKYIPIEKSRPFTSKEEAEQWIKDLSAKAIRVIFYTNLSNFAQVRIDKSIEVLTYGGWGYTSEASLRIEYQGVKYIKNIAASIKEIAAQLNIIKTQGELQYINDILKEKSNAVTERIKTLNRFLKETTEGDAIIEEYKKSIIYAEAELEVLKDDLINLNF